MIKIQNYINGLMVDPSSKTYLDNFNPATGMVYSQIPDSDERDVQKAVEAAVKAFPAWSSMRNEERSAILQNLANLIDANMDDLAMAESIDNGKPLWLAKSVDIPRARDNFSFFASAIKHFDSESHRTSDSIINYTTRKPIGVAGCISPWNLPLYLFSWKVAPALAAGNTVVAKPSEITPMTAYKLSLLCNEAGFPPGVFNIVHGLGAKVGSAIVDHPDVPLISFTGGTTTGAHIAASAAPKFKKLSLELGGKNPNIIFNDCDFDKMLKTTLNSSFANQGQICLCGSRIYVQKGIYDRFKKAFVEEVNSIKVGNPLDSDSRMGAIVSKVHFEKVQSYINLAREEGGSILTGGTTVQLEGDLAGGWYLRPTVIEGLTETCRTNQEEIFGPMVTIQPFETEEEGIALANSTTYGLASIIWTENLSRAHRVADRMKSGIVWVNCWLVRDLRTPFGGVKSSGVGREGGWEALRFFTEPKNVCIKY
ncbi:MAG: aminomuconate-semialdehyde/2-hydroxymuconate-6-semialdehyde dehydrogenase [Bacteroidia bacterium]|jgi:aminomuconate-semialdehyde/2-hydroxymuconate-6-semialdehyde dehydrogenase